MANKPKKQHQQQTTEPATGASARGILRPLHVAGFVLLAIAIAASGALVWQHFGGADLPGCGADSACGKATGSAWGRLPLFNWPVSFVGLAYFIGLAAAWTGVPSRGFGLLPWIARLGALFSILYIVVMLAGQMVCPYCLVAHVANFGFVGVLEFARRSAASKGGADPAPFFGIPIQRLIVGFVVASVVLGGWEFQASKRREAMAEQQLEEFTESVAAAAAETDTTNQEVHDDPARTFIGRYRLGPEAAPIRVVVFTNYQCRDCQRFENEIERIVAARDDVSLSIKHFPMSMQCNPYMSRDMHPNSCWAARAVETAGILGGNEAYWQMHRWVFQRGGSFTQDELRAGLLQLGYRDPDAFIRVMDSNATLELVQQDIEEAMSLGLMFTPMIFINGVEFRGWNAQNGITRGVEAVAATNPAPAYADPQPASAFEKHIADWREGHYMPLSPVPTERFLGPANAPVHIMVFGDYQSPNVAAADATIRELLNHHSNVRYTFRHYPFNQGCNARVMHTMYEHSCWAHLAAEAALHVYGSDGFWKLHDWLLANQENASSMFNNRALRAAAPSLGLDAEAIIETMAMPNVAAGLRADTNEVYVQRVGGMPRVFVNNRWVPRWRLEGHDVLGAIIQEASRQ